MSHLTTGAVVITDIDALKAAAKTFGATLRKTNNFKAYYDMNACEYAIRLPGCQWEIGVVKDKDGTYRLSHDNYGQWGQMLEAKFGKKLLGLEKAYTQTHVTRQAKLHGYSVTRKLSADGEIRLTLTPGTVNYNYQAITGKAA